MRAASAAKREEEEVIKRITRSQGTLLIGRILHLLGTLFFAFQDVEDGIDEVQHCAGDSETLKDRKKPTHNHAYGSTHKFQSIPIVVEILAHNHIAYCPPIK